MNLTCVILAAGLGKRMNSSIPKVLHRVYGIPMLQAVINTVKKLKPKRIVIVVREQTGLIERTIDSKDVVFVFQEKAKGTGHALRCARPALKNSQGVIVVLNGDTPLVNHHTIKKLLALHRRNKDTISVLSFTARNPDNYGRIVRDPKGRVLSIVEHTDADSQQKTMNEVNSGVYAIHHDALHLIDNLPLHKAKGEYYLTDIVSAASKRGLKATAYCIGTEEEFMGVNTKEELHRASQQMKDTIIQKWMQKGVMFLDSRLVFIHPDVSIGRETTIYPNVYLEGQTRIGRSSVIYPNVRIQDSIIGNGVVVKDSSVIEHSRIGNGASVGPFARIRPGSTIGASAKIGNFVEIKKSVIGGGTKASHLSYLGDAVIGKNVNIGAGTITCNYDGQEKHKTEIMDNVFIGSDTQLVAPVHVGKGAYIGAGSTITHDVPSHSLALSRVRQKTIGRWALKRRSKGSSHQRVTKNSRQQNKPSRRSREEED